MKSVSKFLLCAAAAALFQISTAPNAFAEPILGANLAAFAVLGGSTVTNTGATTLTGLLGVSPGSSIGNTPFPSSITVNGNTYDSVSTIPESLPDIHIGGVAATAQDELITAYDDLAGLTPDDNLTGDDLGGMTLISGVYKFDVAAGLTGTLTLNAEGSPDAFWVFQIGEDLTTASTSSVVFINGGGVNTPVFWQVGRSATLGTGTDFVGTIAALTSITLTTDVTIDCGAAYARNGAVTMDTNTITSPCFNLDVTPGEDGEDDVIEVVPIPEPGTLLLMGTGIVALVAGRRRSARA